jgi:hypothetical protein
MTGGSAFDAMGRYDERAALAHDQERFTNPTADAFARHAGMPGRTDTDQMIVNSEALQTARRRVFEMERALALKDEAIALLRDVLTESEAELDTLRGMLAEREGAAA